MENAGLVYYNAGRESVQMVYYNQFAAADAAAAEEQDEDHLYEEIDPHRAPEAGPSGEETPYQRIDLQDVTVYNRVGSDAEAAGASGETEYHLYEEIP